MKPIRWSLVIACLLLVGCATAPSANQPPTVDVTGSWTGLFTWAYGISPITLVLRQTGTEVTGEVLGLGQNSGPVRGTVSGDRVSLAYSSRGAADLVVNGNSMSGVSAAGGNWNLQRQ